MCKGMCEVVHLCVGVRDDCVHDEDRESPKEGVGR